MTTSFSPSVPSSDNSLSRFRILEEADALATCREITICDDRDGDVAEIWIDEFATVNTTRDQAIELARLWVAAPDLRDALQALAKHAEPFAHSHTMISNGYGTVEGKRLRETIDRARAALSLVRTGAPDV